MIYLMHGHKMTNSIYDKKPELLKTFIEGAAFGSLSMENLELAGKEIGLSKGEVLILAPNGPISMIDYWFAQADEFMAQEIQKREGLKIREKATLAVRARLEYLGQNKEALRRAIALLALPQNAARGIKIGMRFVDAAWRAFGDKSTDFNFYTKRMTLLGVGISTAAFFLVDDSENNQETWNFLDRRIENIMQFEKAKAGFRKFTGNLPDPIPFLARLRFGAKPEV